MLGHPGHPVNSRTLTRSVDEERIMARMPSASDDPASIFDLLSALKSQYHAALAMLRQAVERCPEELWGDGGHANPYWHIAYHTLFFTHLYLQPNEEAFHPWEHHREEYQFLGSLPWPPHRVPKIEQPYMQAQVLEYWQVCEQMIDLAVDRLDLESPECGFWWYTMSKFEHQLMNIRHIQHHAAQLADRLRPAAGIGVDWVGAGNKRQTGEEE
jgi:hypothetical protein